MPSQTPQDVKDAAITVLAVARSIQGLHQKPYDLTPTDVLALCVEPVLQSLDWDTRDPAHVRRVDGETLKLSENGATPILVRASAMRESLPESPEGPGSDEAEWLVLTNGVTWSIFNQRSPGRAFRTLSLETAEGAREGSEILAMMAAGSFGSDGLIRAWMAEAIDADVSRALVQHLDGSEALVSALAERLKSDNIEADASDIRAALARLSVHVGEAPNSETPNSETPKPETPKPESSSATTEVEPAAITPGPAPAEAGLTETARTEAAKAGAPAPEASPEMAPASGAPGSGDEPRWPRNATHAMRRKGNIAFARIAPKTGITTLLPDSILARNVGRSVSVKERNLREKMVQDETLVPEGEKHMRLTQPVEFRSFKQAATFAAGALVKNPDAFVDRKGVPYTLPDRKVEPARAAAEDAGTGSATTSGKPASSRSTGKAAGRKPAKGKASTGKSATGKSATGKSATGKSATGKSATGKKAGASRRKAATAGSTDDGTQGSSLPAE